MFRSHGVQYAIAAFALAGVMLSAPVASALPLTRADGQLDPAMQLATLTLEAHAQAVVLLGP